LSRPKFCLCLSHLSNSRSSCSFLDASNSFCLSASFLWPPVVNSFFSFPSFVLALESFSCFDLYSSSNIDLNLIIFYFFWSSWFLILMVDCFLIWNWPCFASSNFPFCCAIRAILTKDLLKSSIFSVVDSCRSSSVLAFDLSLNN